MGCCFSVSSDRASSAFIAWRTLEGAWSWARPVPAATDSSAALSQNILKLDLNNLTDIKYSPDPLELMEEADADPLKVAFFLNPVKIQQIINIAMSGNKMPPKSTYFYPKVLSGLVVNKFEKG